MIAPEWQDSGWELRWNEAFHNYIIYLEMHTPAYFFVAPIKAPTKMSFGKAC